jgi:hypothetical protein
MSDAPFRVGPERRSDDPGAVDASTVDGTYGTQERDVIIDLRVKVDAITAALRKAGFLE